MRVAANSSSKIVLQYLRYVLAAAEKHSFRQAAVELGVWESTISRGIRDLEHEMGVALTGRAPASRRPAMNALLPERAWRVASLR
jgi:DNA-binding transcriptional LysR family regulator